VLPRAREHPLDTNRLRSALVTPRHRAAQNIGLRSFIGEYRTTPWLRIPPLSRYVDLYEMIGSAVHPTKVIGICLNTYDQTDEQAREACRAAAAETGLPCTDPVRFDPAPLVNAIVRERDNYLERRRI